MQLCIDLAGALIWKREVEKGCKKIRTKARTSVPGSDRYCPKSIICVHARPIKNGKKVHDLKKREKQERNIHTKE